MALLLIAASHCSPAAAGVAVVANRTAERVFLAVRTGDGPMQTVPIDGRQLITLQVDQPIEAAVFLAGQWQRVSLAPNSVHYFVVKDAATLFVPVALPGAPAEVQKPSDERKAIATIPVVLLVDEEEPAVRRLWEKRLRDRLNAASDVFQRVCRVRFEVSSVGTWTTNNSINEFEQSLAEFERSVDPAPARLAIGFSSQYQIPQGRIHMGGTRGPMHSHILIREWSNHVTEPERLEILVHELGHFLGAIHSAEPDSVMRPTLGDRRANDRRFQIGFDPGNAFALFLVGEQLRQGNVTSFAGLNGTTKQWLAATYRALAPALPDDDSAAQYIGVLAQPVPALAPRVAPPK